MIIEEKNIEDLKRSLLDNFQGDKRSLVEKAYMIAQEQLKEIYRENKHPFIEHALCVALIVSNELGLKWESVAAIFLHEATRSSFSLFSQVQSAFPYEVIQIVDGLNKISKITPRHTRLQAENYRKLIVSYSNDPRVTLIKLADRLEIMRNLSIFPKGKISQKLTETQMLYIPLAHQLGLYNIKGELENLYFKYSDPEHYLAITNKLLATKIQREELIKDFVRPLEVKLKEENIKFILKVRTKTAWSIWQKMQKQNLSFEEVYDVFAIRFILDVPFEDEKAACWKVYSLVTQEYKPDVERLRDWITNPKPNGYESLHTTVKNKDGAFVEVQIRTIRMDEIAENGHASHWSYKGVQSVQGLDQWLERVKQLLNDKTIGASGTFTTLEHLSEIFVFTPVGDLKKLPKGATVLDFAFSIHSNIGMTCSGAKINGKIKSIREELHTGDTVEILTTKNQKPSYDWLNIVVSQKARSHIKSRLAQEEGKMIHLGYEILQRRLKNWKVELTDSLIADITKYFKKKNSAELFIGINDKTISLQAIKDFIENKEEKEIKTHAEEKKNVKEGKSSKYDYLTIGDKINSISFRMSKCCNPIYGDDVFGFVSSSGGVSIHRITCPNAKRLISLYPYRIQKVRWREQTTSSQFQTGLKVTGVGDSSVGNTILQSVTSCGASIRAFRVEERKRSKLEFIVEMEISVGSNAHLDKVISSLKKMKEVVAVLRTIRLKR